MPQSPAVITSFLFAFCHSSSTLVLPDFIYGYIKSHATSWLRIFLMFVTFRLKSKFIDNALEIHYTSSTVMPLSLCVYATTYTHSHIHTNTGSCQEAYTLLSCVHTPEQSLSRRYVFAYAWKPHLSVFSLLPPLSVCTTTQTGRLPLLCNKCWVHSTPSKSQLYDIIALPPEVS